MAKLPASTHHDKHTVHFSIHDSVAWCEECEWMEIYPYTEQDIDAAITEAIAHDHPTWSHLIAYGPCTLPSFSDGMDKFPTRVR